MPCLMVILAFFTPRLVIALTVIFGRVFSEHLPPPFLLWLILGFLFAPYSLLMYTAIEMWGPDSWGLIQYGLMAVAVISDLSASDQARRKKAKRE